VIFLDPVRKNDLNGSLAMEKNFFPEKFYYGWVVVAVALVSMSYWFGLRATFSIFFVALVDHFHWGRAETAGVQSVAMVAYTIAAPFAGMLVDRIGLRKVILPGIVLMGLGLFLCSRIQTVTQFYLFYGVIVGVGVTSLSIVPFTVILSHWFERKRGMANGLAGMGIGIGPLVFVPFLQYLISYHGWPGAYLAFAALVLIIPLPLNAIFLKHRPQEMGLLPDGDRTPPIFERKNHGKGHEGPSSPLNQREKFLTQEMKKKRFWFLLLFPCLTVFGVYIIIVHHVRYLVDLGVDKMWAASLFAGTGVLSALFRFFWGWFSDRMGREITFTLGGACFSTGILFLILYSYHPSTLVLFLFALLFGPGWGSTAPMFMSIAGDLYRGKHFGLIYGMVEGGIGVGAAVGSWVAGYLFDRSQSYLWAFILALLFNIVSIFIVWCLAPGKIYQVANRSPA
jgi:MFS family permease